MDNSAIFIGLFIFSMVIDALIVSILYVLSKDITDLHKFITSFLDYMINFENEKLEIIKRREENGQL